MHLNDPVHVIDKVGPKTAELFQKLNIFTVNDLLHYFPRDYAVYKDITPVCEVQEGYHYALQGILKGRTNMIRKGSKTVVTAVLSDGTASIDLVWFNMPYLKSRLVSGNTIVVWGRILKKNNKYVLEQPEIYTPDGYAQKKQTMQPVYGLTFGLKNGSVLRAIRTCLNDSELINEIRNGEYLGSWCSLSFPALYDSYEWMHFPTDKVLLQKAHDRFVYEEFLDFILTFRFREGAKEIHASNISIEKDTYREIFRNSLPFTLTDSQVKVEQEIMKDLLKGNVMNRLVQGDVGSGKTVVAILSMLPVIENGYQAALMAPTEVLAVQHYHSITNMLNHAGLPVRTELLTGSLTAKEKRLAYERIRRKEVDLIIGTHALIQERVEYASLGMVITDEQHRFGVHQREIFSEKGTMPHTLVMSATPIPRTLALILYGDLDVSVMEKPPMSRLPIKSCAVPPAQRNTSYKFIMNQIKEGHQCYVICPMVESSENLDGEDVVTYSEKLRKIFPPSVSIAYLHGKMSNDRKNAVMTEFQNNRIQILVSTTVVEVGVDVPNATVILIENAERFGLSTLHQLRGRVGRGDAQSYCILVSPMETETAKSRLDTLVKSNDGFYIAREDLKQRGPGEFLGRRQSGDFHFRLGDIYLDADLLTTVNEDIDRLLAKDPDLSNEPWLREHLELSAKAIIL